MAPGTQIGPFLTDLDKRAEVKGSRDPLGIQPIWSLFGRYVVGNLTTVTSSVRDFSTLLIGLYLVERIAEIEPEKSPLTTFLQWEQLAGYAREVHNDGAFRGIDRVRRRLAESSAVTLSGDRRDQILADQKITGVWGLYTVAARASGLIEGESPRLSRAARRLVEHVYFSRMADILADCRDGRALVRLLKDDSVRIDLQGKHQRLAEAISTALSPKLQSAECSVFQEHLVEGGRPNERTEGRQAEFARLLLLPEFGTPNFSFRPSTMEKLERCASVKYPQSRLASSLARIRHCESLMAPASDLFAFLLDRDGTSIDEIAKTVRNQWGNSIPSLAVTAIETLKPDFAQASRDDKTSIRWLNIASCLREGDYAQAIRLLLEQNAHVMSTRGGAAPWIEERNQQLHVRFSPNQHSELPTAKALPELWTFSYFLHAFRAITRAVHEGMR